MSDIKDGITLRDYFAAHAPEAVPDWFTTEFRPEIPCFPSEYYSPKERERERAIEKYKKECEIYDEALVKWRWNRLVNWRYAYADAMLAARETGK